MTNSQISGIEASQLNGNIGTANHAQNVSRNNNTSKHGTFTDTNGVIKNMSMMHSYETQDTKELKVEKSTSSNKGNLKKISIDIKPK